ncbi:hypothetical protein UCRPC4_g04321 [Phaeomoniella chlamydospora]|uniref:Uncharacterized protein n=1 Tax=Phaeomoniella chlamydospora TaxID=158046 RepID=A0A0G2G8I8_PHACM|nr:hypothetical protein UCRPC4_g04321 [Phaeomoniella chlamydospora]
MARMSDTSANLKLSTSRTFHWSKFFFDRLTPDQKASVNHVHIFPQQQYFETLGKTLDLPSLSSIQARTLTLTFRYSDWWGWESPLGSSSQLAMCPWIEDRCSKAVMEQQPLRPDLRFVQENMKKGTWGYEIGTVKGLEELIIEFETDVLKKEQLGAVAERAKGWRFLLNAMANEDEDVETQAEKNGNARVLVWKPPLQISAWIGPRDLKEPILGLDGKVRETSWRDREMENIVCYPLSKDLLHNPSPQHQQSRIHLHFHLNLHPPPPYLPINNQPLHSKLPPPLQPHA